MLGALGSQERLRTLKFLEGEGDGKVKAQQRGVVRREHFLEVDGEGKAQPVPGATGEGVLGRGMKWRRSHRSPGSGKCWRRGGRSCGGWE